MNKKSFFLAILICFMAFCVVYAQDDGITISGEPRLTMTFTATSDDNFSGNFEWFSASRADTTFWNHLSSHAEYHSGANHSEFTIPIESPNLLGQFIRARRRNHITGGNVWSNVIGPIRLADSGSIAISGTPQLGSRITAKADPNFSGNYRWYFSYSENPSVWTELNVRNSDFNNSRNRSEFTIPATDLNGTSLVGMFIRVDRLHNNVSHIDSNVLGPIQQGTDSMVIISGSPRVGVRFTATSDDNFSGNFEWFSASRADATSWNSLSRHEVRHSGVNRSVYTITAADPNLLGQYIRARRRNFITGRDVWSNVIGPIRP